MPDSMDRRREGKVITDKQFDQYFERTLRKRAGLCTHCGKASVFGRSYCYTCTDRTKEATKRSIVRKVLKEYTGMTPEEAIQALKSKKVGDVQSLTNFFEYITKQRSD